MAGDVGMTRAGVALVTPRRRELTHLVRRLGSWWEITFAAGAMLLLSSAVLPLLLGELQSAAADDVEFPFQRLLYRLAYVGSIAFAAVRGREVWRSLARNPFIVALVGLGLASAAWSVAPVITAQRCVSLVATTALGAYIGSRYGVGRIVDLLAWILGISVLLSVCVAVVAPAIGVQTTAQGVVGWRGVYTHKNTLGTMATLALLVFTLKWKSGGSHRWVAGTALALSAVAVVMSRAVTAVIVSAGLLLLLPLLGALRMRRDVGMRLVVAAVFAGAAAALGLLAYREAVLEALGRGTTLTGRTDMWPVIVSVARDHTWLGHGFAAFWLGWDGPSARVWERIGWAPRHAHNGFIDLFADLGLVGVIVFALAYAVTLQRALRLARAADDDATRLWPSSYLAFLALQNVVDSTLLNMRAVSLYWILFVATACAVGARRAPTAAPGGVPIGSLSPGVRRLRRTPGRGLVAGAGAPASVPGRPAEPSPADGRGTDAAQ